MADGMGIGAPRAPVTMVAPRVNSNWLDFCTKYVAARWDGAAAKTRDSITDSLATAALVCRP